jgi:hypothetical protein
MSRKPAESLPAMTAEEKASYVAMLATMSLANLLVYVYIAPSA